MFKKIKRATAIILAGAMMLGTITACGDTPSTTEDGTTEAGTVNKDTVFYTVDEASTTEVMKVGDYSIKLDEVLLYLFQELYTKGAKSETVDSLSVACRTTALSNIRETYIIYDVAMHNDIEITDEDISVSDGFASNFIQAFGNTLAQFGISEDAVKESFKKQMVVQKFENDIKNSMGQQINDDFNKEYEEVKFVSLYQIMYPIVEVENGNPVYNEDGTPVYVSDEEKAEIKAKLEEIQEEAKTTDNPEGLAAKYGLSDYSATTNGYIGGFSEPYNTMIAELNNGEVTEVIEAQLGYAFYYMVNNDDQQLKAAYTYSLSADMLSNEYEKLRNSWLATIEIDTENDMNGTIYDDISLADMVASMEANGVTGTNANTSTAQ